VVALLPFRIADVIVAFAPGAQDTMMVLALAMHLDPVYVGAHHLARFLAVSFSVAVVARRLVHREPTRPRNQATRPGAGTVDASPHATYSRSRARRLGFRTFRQAVIIASIISTA